MVIIVYLGFNNSVLLLQSFALCNTIHQTKSKNPKIISKSKLSMVKQNQIGYLNGLI